MDIGRQLERAAQPVRYALYLSVGPVAAGGNDRIVHTGLISNGLLQYVQGSRQPLVGIQVQCNTGPGSNPLGTHESGPSSRGVWRGGFGDFVKDHVHDGFDEVVEVYEKPALEDFYLVLLNGWMSGKASAGDRSIVQLGDQLQVVIQLLFPCGEQFLIGLHGGVRSFSRTKRIRPRTLERTLAASDVVTRLKVGSSVQATCWIGASRRFSR